MRSKKPPSRAAFCVPAGNGKAILHEKEKCLEKTGDRCIKAGMTFCFVVAAIFDLFSAYFCIRSFVFHLFFAHFLLFGRTAPS